MFSIGRLVDIGGSGDRSCGTKESLELLGPGRAFASTDIVQGATSVSFEPSRLCGPLQKNQVSVSVNNCGAIDLDENSKQKLPEDMHWIRSLRLSDDCHSCNIQLRLQPYQRTSKLFLQTIRPIEAGQELLLWFSEDILAMLQIVFLTPANIQGQKKYVCTRCTATFESPNPLKLHITFACGRKSVVSPWDKLSNIFSTSKTKELEDHSLLTKVAINRQRFAMDLSTANIKFELPVQKTCETLYRPSSVPSAFKPFQKCELKNSENVLSTANDLIRMWKLIPMPENNPAFQLNVNKNSGDEAQLETLVSSLGKSKQGHLCLYCGKCYSRKYGLKIHIRTHTGYKPLKCKYCLRPFGDPSNLNKHVRLHAEGETPYKCDLCGKVLVRRRDLERHLKSRHMAEMHPGVGILEDSCNEEIESGD